MKPARLLPLGVLIFIFAFSTLIYAGVPQMISYQGKLTTHDNKLFNATVSMIFTIYDAPADGAVLWTETQPSVVIEKGLFGVLLGSVNPIPDSVFNGDVRYLGIKIGDDSEMSPRKEIVSVGYAYKSEHADTAKYARAAAGVGDNDWTFRITDTADTTLITGGEWGIARHGNILFGNADSTHVNLGGACTTGTNGQNFKYCTVAGGWFNTASAQSATIGGGEYNTASDIFATVGGGWDNTASGSHATVGGGQRNTASGDYATVGGGPSNSASGGVATVGGGQFNTASGLGATVGGGDDNTAGANWATIGGGEDNTASGAGATVGGGEDNTASGAAATVGGGRKNTASGYAGTIPGGYADTVAGDNSFAAGQLVRIASGANYTFAFGRNFTTATPNAVIFHNSVDPIKVGIGTTSPDEELHVAGNIKMVDGNQAAGKVLTSDANGVGTWQAAAGGADNDWTFRMTDTADTTLITGGEWGIARSGNVLHGNADSTHVNLGVACTTGTSGENRKYCTVGGGHFNAASYHHATVGGGSDNTASYNYATVGGGRDNTASGSDATVGGGGYNTASGVASSTVGGGFRNTASGNQSTIGGGYYNTASYNYATVGGGEYNTASSTAATVGGGWDNTASNSAATVGGGYYNTASGLYSTVGGGYYNSASGLYSTVGGGHDNIASDYATVGGGSDNNASADGSTVGGGSKCNATGICATIPGGAVDTVAGDYSFAAGRLVRLASSADYTFGFGCDFRTSTPHAAIFYDALSEMKVGIQTTGPTARLDVNSSTGYNQIRMRTSYTPTGTADANGNKGDIAWDDSYIYIKTSAGWKRAALSTW